MFRTNWLALLLLSLLAIQFNSKPVSAAVQGKSDQLGTMFIQHIKDTAGLYVWDLTQGEDGFIYITTKSGLYRYDGYDITKEQFASNRELEYETIRNIKADTNNTLWMASVKSGLIKYNATTKLADIVYPVIEGQSAYFLEVTENKIYFGSSSALYTYDKITEQVHPITDIIGCNIGSISHISHTENTLFISSDNGICAAEQSEDSQLVGEEIAPLQSYSIRYFLVEPEVIWFSGQESGLYALNRSSSEIIQLTSSNTREPVSNRFYRFITHGKRLWASSYGYGLFEFDAESKQLLSQHSHDINNIYGLTSNSIYGVFKDSSDGIWISGFGSEIHYINSTSDAVRWLPSNSTQMSGGIHSFAEDDKGNLYFGSSGAGIDIFHNHKHRGAIRQSQNGEVGLPDNYISALHYSDNGILWIGTQTKGVVQYDTNNKEFIDSNLPNILKTTDANFISEDGDYLIFISAYNFVVYNRETGKLINSEDLTAESSIKGYIISYSLQEGKGVWLVTDNGLYFYEYQSTQIYHVPSPEVSNNKGSVVQLSGLLLDTQSRLWLSTNIGIFVAENASKSGVTFEYLNPRLNLGEEPVGNNLLEDSYGRIWTTLGVIDINEQTFAPIIRINANSTKHFYASALLKTDEGNILYGSSRGVAAILPDRLTSLSTQSPIRLTSIQVGSEPVYIAESEAIIIPPNNNSIKISFTALDYFTTNAIRYRYRLVGFDNNWQYTTASARYAIYQNLPKGEYQFQLQYRDYKGNWSQSSYQKMVIRQPAWFETMLFWCLSAVSAMLLLYLVYRLRVRHLLQQELHLQQLVDQRTAEAERKNQELEAKNHALNQALKEIERLSLTDQLTDAHNRRFFDSFIGKELMRIKRMNQSEPSSSYLGLVLIDADNFKLVNDTYGHSVGDSVLVDFVKVLRSACRESDWLVRMGGEEFLFVCQFNQAQELQILAERIKQEISNHQFETKFGNRLHCTCSIGVIAYPFRERIDEPSIENLLHIADKLMYQSKWNGRNAWATGFFTTDCLNDQAQGNLSEVLTTLKENGSLHIATSFEAPIQL